jgi:hypothetical protein
MFSTMEISSIILGEVIDFKSRHLLFKFVDITTQEENLVVLQAHTLQLLFNLTTLQSHWIIFTFVSGLLH